MTGAVAWATEFGPHTRATTVSSVVAAAARAAGADPLTAARVGLATSVLVGRDAHRAEVGIDGGPDRAEVRIVVRGGRGTCADLPAGLVDDCNERLVGVMVERTATARMTPELGTDPLVAPLYAALEDHLAAPDLLGAALATVERLLRQRASERSEADALRVELEETSRGLVAVYAESSDEMAEVEQARDHAVEAGHAKAEYLANMSHEIRSPLSAVVGFTGLLLETDLNAEQAEYAEAIRTAGKHLRGVVDDVLDLSKIDAGRLDLEDVPFDPVMCVEDALGIVTATAEDKGLLLAARFADDVPTTVGGDPVRLRQILVNLLSNAVKFTPHGDITVDVHARPEPGRRCRVVFHVRDTGIGIAPDAIDRIFSRYGQAEAATARTFGGTGLGLAICRHLAQLMGGDLTVESTVGSGSTFTGTVVVRLIEERQADVPLRGRHVLVVHDHEPTADAVRATLRGWGAAVTWTATAGEAIRLVSAWRDADVAVVGSGGPLMDLASTVDGISAAHPPGLPVVAVIPLAARPEINSSSPIKAAVRMPVRRGHLREALLAALGRPPALDRSTRGPSPAPAVVAAAGTAPHQPADRHVLYVDDDPMLTALVQRILANQPDIRLATAPRGQVALDLIARRTPDLVLLDLHLPDMTGEELLKRLRADDRYHRLPVVILSGDTTPDTRTRLLSDGATEYVSKPFTPHHLRQVVVELLAGNSSGRRP